MARVPVTARQKFSEAAYFYNGMLAHRTNSVVFPYYLSAFVSALRSVTFYLQKQYAHEAAFGPWYESKQEEMRADPVLKLLVEKRNLALHQEPFDLHFKQGFKMPEKYGGVITTNHLMIREETDPTGQIKMSLKVGEDGPEEPVEPQISWHFAEDDPRDVMQHCYEGLQKLDAMLKELSGLGLEQERGVADCRQVEDTVKSMELPSDEILDEAIPDISLRAFDDPGGMDWFRAVAAHEAAHAVVTTALGIAVERVLVVQRSGLIRHLYSERYVNHNVKEDCSHSKPNQDQYEKADPVIRCLISRAGEIGQRLHVGDDGTVDAKDWLDDRNAIGKLILPEAKLSGFLETLRAAVEPWLKEPEQERIWRQLTERLSDNPEHADKDPNRYRKVLEGEELQEFLKAIPKFPDDRVPAMPSPAEKPEPLIESP